jgi:hypothetical protein
MFRRLIPVGQPLSALRVVGSFEGETSLSVFDREVVESTRVRPPKLSRFQRVG